MRAERNDHRIAQAQAIADLNDTFRAGLPITSENPLRFSPGLLRLLEGLPAFDFFQQRAELIQLVTDHDCSGLSADEAKRDFGLFQWRGRQCCWKIEYFSADLAERSRNPADPAMTMRVLTIMLFSEF